MYKLDEWLPIESTDITFKGCDVVKVMFTTFEGDTEDIGVKFLYEDNSESEYYHPSKWELLLEQLKRSRDLSKTIFQMMSWLKKYQLS